jgi:hypothetical protein
MCREREREHMSNVITDLGFFPNFWNDLKGSALLADPQIFEIKK